MKKLLKNICVYCGSGAGNNPAYAEAASTLGKAMARADIGLVYGGGSIGLMGEIAQTVL
ncbi:MAG: TIGR00730 family Rossman fold protein, partial [Pseudomonadota bacterium]